MKNLLFKTLIKIISLIALLSQFSCTKNISNLTPKGKENNHEILSKIWKIAKKEACTNEMKRNFNDKEFKRIKKKIIKPYDRHHLQEILNPFFLSLGKSHTEFFGPRHEGFHFFRSHTLLSNKKDKLPPLPKYFNPGLQFYKTSKNMVREVFDGLSASKAGLQKQDVIIDSNGTPFLGFWESPGLKKLKIKRNKKIINVSLNVPQINLSNALFNAQKNSVKIFKTYKKKIGYIHLWTGTHPKSALHLKETVESFRHKTDAMILDMRGGYGGAWWDHLDPFFRDRTTFFKAEFKDAEGHKSTLKPEEKINKLFYDKPLVVLINQGVRSGKEAVAYQIKKTKRGLLIGEDTPGYFTLGKFLFSDENKDHIFYFCRKTLTLDSKVIEGVGVKADIKVKFSSSGDYKDSQLESGINHLLKALNLRV